MKLKSLEKRQFDLLSVGELLVDLISTSYSNSFNEAAQFQRFPGGSPANLCMNMARLGNKTKLVATLGKDDLGNYLLNFVQGLPIDCQSIQQISLPTSLILVTKSKSTANFEAYRGADCQITTEQLTETTYKKVSIFHTTCFALSKKPAQTSIFKAAKKAQASGCQLSIDANYAAKIWPNQAEAQQIFSDYCALGAMVKISEVDWERLYNTPLKHPEKAVKFLLNLGAKEVCLTLGENGCWVGNSKELQFLPARKVKIVDTTGAGDAFWSGYLTAYLAGKSLINRAKAGRKMAELKLSQEGALPDRIDWEIIYEDFV